jgi:dUTP pyrophosphatase
MFGNMVKIKKLHPEATIPTYAHKGDAGADLYSCEDVLLLPGRYKLISTGIAIAMSPSWVGLVHPRSGLAAKHGVTIVNAPGTVDSGYRGEIKVNLINLGQEAVQISKGDRIAQLVFQRFEQADFLEVDELEITDRGENGFGSTGGLSGRIQGS